MIVRTFVLMRHEDVSGISGTGPVAVGVQFPTGKVAIEWLGRINGIGVFNSIAELIAIHGHEGKTVVQWVMS